MTEKESMEETNGMERKHTRQHQPQNFTDHLEECGGSPEIQPYIEPIDASL